MTSHGEKHGEFPLSSYYNSTEHDNIYRKVEGEAKGEAHGDGGPATSGSSVPLRRWEDWERSRLRKLRREERRRREFERQHGSYMTANGELLTVRSGVHSQYEGSDTMSVASSEDEHWAAQIGGYNENSAAYPPPPMGLMAHASISGDSMTPSELESMLEHGYDDRPQQYRDSPQGAQRYQLSDRPGGYTPLARTGASSPTGFVNGHSSAADPYRTHAKKRSGGGGPGGRYGPLGPLDPGSHF